VKVGGNGTGKTTLLKILLGDLRPVHGVHHAHRSLRIGYFSQHHVDQLDMNVSAVQVLEAKFPGLYFVFSRWLHPTCLENLEMSGNLTAVREMSGILLKIRELSGKKTCQGKVA